MINIPFFVEIIIEIILAVFAIYISDRYWRYLYSPYIFFKTLKDYEKIKNLYNDTRANIKDFMHDNISGGYEKHISSMLDNIIKEFKSEKNNALIWLVIVELISFLFLGWLYGAIILAFYFIVYFYKVKIRAEKKVLQDISIIMHGVKEWNKQFPDDCREFCNRVYPKLLKTIYKVIGENSN